MAIGERGRRELQEALVGTIGPDPTDTLLGYLPPVGWADVVTKRDLEHFATQLRLEMTEFKADQQIALNHLLRWMVGLVFVVVLTVIGTGILTR